MQTEVAKPAPGFGLDFLKFWAGQTISNLGSSFTAFALPLLVYKLTGSALDLAITTASTFLPYALFGLFIGALVDRSDRRRMMIITDILRALVIAAIPLVAALGWLAVGWIYLISFLISVLTIFFNAGEFTAAQVNRGVAKKTRAMLYQFQRVMQYFRRGGLRPPWPNLPHHLMETVL